MDGGGAAHGSTLVAKLGTELTEDRKNLANLLYLLLQAVHMLAVVRTEELQDFSIFLYKS